MVNILDNKSISKLVIENDSGGYLKVNPESLATIIEDTTNTTESNPLTVQNHIDNTFVHKTETDVLNIIHTDTDSKFAAKQDKLTAGANIDIDSDSVIKVTGLDAKQNKLTSDNAGDNISITEESGVVKINSIKGATSFAELSGQPSDNTNLNTALNAKQDKLTSANAGANVTIVENEGIVTISASTPAVVEDFTKEEIETIWGSVDE